jgi:hypothetical protein
VKKKNESLLAKLLSEQKEIDNTISAVEAIHAGEVICTSS